MSHDEFDVRAALTDWYAAMTAHDIPAVGEALTESFLLIEHDELLDRSQLLEILSSESDDDFIAELTDFRVTVHGDVAWSTHRNHEVYTPALGEQLQLEFLETVVLVRRDGRWLIDRYHATRLSPATM
jgi:ketosteroid isomerase-like protein